MKLEKCTNGHYFDADKFNDCPHCNEGNDTPTRGLEHVSQADITVPLEKPHTASSEPKPISGNAPQWTMDEEKTIGLKRKTSEIEPVVGWLVCIQGKSYGKDYRLKEGRNFIGRNSNMDISLTDDTTVSREKHAIIVFEPKHNMFLAQPGDSKELFYVNDDVVLSTKEINKNDKLQIGDNTFMLIPCCDSVFNWKEIEKKEEN